MQTAPVALPVTVDTAGAKILDGDGLSGPDQKDSRDIWLPNWVETVSHIAVDVGGSLAKVVYFTRTAKPSQELTESESSASSSSDSSILQPLDTTLSQQQQTPRSRNGSSSSSLLSASLAPSSPNSRLHSRESSADPNGHFPDSARSHSPLSSQWPPHRPQNAEGSTAMLGGTLTPSSLFSNRAAITPRAMNAHLLTRRALPSQLPGGRLNFIKFETENIVDCVAFLQELISSSAKANNVSLQQMRKGVKLMATGGGAHKYHKMFEEELGVEVRREDEMGCLITGLNFITLIPDEAFYYSDELVDSFNANKPPTSLARNPMEQNSTQHQLPRPSPDPPLYAPVFESNPLPKLPCLLVNIGSGVSIIKVDDHGKFERVSGTSLGGGTLWGLLSLLTDADSFDEMLELASQGDNGTVDMLVSDIYGSSDALTSLGLKSNTIASSFGKVFRKEDAQEGENRHGRRERRKKKFRQEDICKSLLYAVSNNIGQIAYMNAEKFGLDRIYFGGCFIRGHQATIATLSYAIRFWSKGTKRAFFLRHEGYLGAVGCWIKQLSEPECTPKKSKARHHIADNNGVVSSESKVSTPKSNGKPVNGMGDINPILAEALGGLSMDETQSAIKKAPMTNGHTHSRDFGSLVVAPADVKALKSDEDESKDVASLLSSLSEEDKALLGPLVQSGSADEEISLAALLKQLDVASGAADGLESKLDSLLGRLDSLLEDQDKQ